jgi:hypothetical protein
MKSSSMNVSANTKNKALSLTKQQLEVGCRLGIDSHADMTCIGAHAKILEVYEGQLCNIQPFNDLCNLMKNIRTVNEAFAYDSNDGNTYVLEVNKYLDFSHTMEHLLLCPNQASVNGVCETLELTSTDHWDTSLWDNTDVSSIEVNDDDLNDFACEFMRHVEVSSVHHGRGQKLTPSDLAKLWKIGLSEAKRTLNQTTQDYIRYLDGKLSRRVKTLAHQNRYKQLSGYLGGFCSDTFKSNVESSRGNKYM